MVEVSNTQELEQNSDNMQRKKLKFTKETDHRTDNHRIRQS